MRQHYIIIGAGILGASTAYHLSKRDVDVTVIDKEHEGKATDVAAGIICPWLSQRRNKQWYTLAKNGAAYYPSLIKELERQGEKDTGYEQVGVLSLQLDEKKADKILTIATKRKEDALEMGEIRKLSSEEIQGAFPPLTNQLSAVHATGGAKVNGKKIAQALLKAAEKNGAQLLRGEASLVKKGTEVVGVLFENEELLSDKIIVTAGAWASSLLEPLQVEFKVKPQKAQILELELVNQKTDEWPVVLAPSTLYFVGFENGQMVVGTTHEDDKGFDTKPTAGAAQEILTKAFEVAPSLKKATYMKTLVGLRPVVPTFIPVIGSLPQYGNVFVANGLGSSGLTVGPYLGRELAELASGGNPEIDVEQYSLGSALASTDKGEVDV